MLVRFIAIILCTVATQSVSAKECWVLTNLHGNMALSSLKYSFSPDGFSNPMILCFNDDNSGSVTGDDSRLVRFGNSTLIGWATNQGIELVTSYQIDRVNGNILFTKSRIGTATAYPGMPDVVGAFAGKAERIKQ